ncbi:MAG: RNA polymerase sigma factor [Planctomycetota bacterium]
MPTLPIGADSTAESSTHDLEPELLHRLHRIARRVLGCDHLADDAVQETLIALWREGDRPAHLAAWLATAVLHRSLHLRRTLSRRAKHEHAAASRCSLHGDCDNPLHLAVAHELAADIDHACRCLPSEQRLAFTLANESGLDYRAISDRLGVPVGTVHSRIARARAAIRRKIRISD